MADLTVLPIAPIAPWQLRVRHQELLTYTTANSISHRHELP
jgi:hypothetical protein